MLKQSVGSLTGEKVERRNEVQVRLDFLALNPGEEGKLLAPERPKKKKEEIEISVPRETASYRSRDDDETVAEEEDNPVPENRAPAYIPLNYIREPQQRISIYRKLAQVTDKEGIEAIRTELRDRFGKIPPAVDLLLQVTELKIIASDKQVSSIETEGAKLKITRRKELVQVGGKFPRLSKKEPKAKLGEIKRLLLML